VLTVTTPTPTPTIPVVVVDGPGANAWEVIGAIGGAAGVLLAVFLAWYGGYQVRKERRIIHEIDVLRDLVARSDDAGRGAGSISVLRGLLLILGRPSGVPRAAGVR
jgi:hypothetical protein